jgi:hypothetical protein
MRSIFSSPFPSQGLIIECSLELFFENQVGKLIIGRASRNPVQTIDTELDCGLAFWANYDKTRKAIQAGSRLALYAIKAASALPQETHSSGTA